MDKSGIRLVVAATVMAAVALELFELVIPYRLGAVWAQEAKAEKKKPEEKKKEEAVLGFTCRIRKTERQPGALKPSETTEVVRVSPQYGWRMDTYAQGKLALSMYTNYTDGTTITLFHTGPRGKTYTRRDGPKGPPPGGESYYDPRPRIKKALAGEHRKLGRRTIDGVQAEGIEVPGVSGVFGGGGGGNAVPGSAGNNKPNVKRGTSATSQLWSSVETGYPILTEENLVLGNGAFRMKRTTDQFRWNVRFDPNEFKARIPPDYQLMDMQQMLQRGGAGAPMSGRGPAPK